MDGILDTYDTPKGISAAWDIYRKHYLLEVALDWKIFTGVQYLIT
jgi:hypothetical protein